MKKIVKILFLTFYKKQAFLDYVNMGLKKPPNLPFSKEIGPCFWSKLWDFVNFSFYAEYTEKKYLVMFSWKQAFPDNGNVDLSKPQNWHFCKLYQFGKNLNVFSSFQFICLLTF